MFPDVYVFKNKNICSGTLPADWDANPVKVLVASNFHEVVFDNTKVRFYVTFNSGFPRSAWDFL